MNSTQHTAVRSVPQIPMSAGSLSRDNLAVLKAPFPMDRLGVKVQSYNREKTRAMLVLYLQHTDVQDRLEEVDPAWSVETVAEERTSDTVYVRSRLTILGTTRENVGEGNDPKSAASDALKRCAMLFGVGRYLYDTETVWTPYDEAKDRFRQWTVDDYNAAARPHQKAPMPKSDEPAEPRKAIAPKKGAAPADPAAPQGERERLNRTLLNLYRPFLTQFPQTQFAGLLQDRYQVGETRLLSVAQLQDFVGYMQKQLQSVA